MSDTAGLVVTGIGVTTAVGRGKADCTRALFAGEHRFAVMGRPGRQSGTRFVGAGLPAPAPPPAARLGARVPRTASLTGQVALATLEEAWTEAMNVFGGSAVLDVMQLARHRELDPARLHNLLMQEKTSACGARLPHEVLQDLRDARQRGTGPHDAVRPVARLRALALAA